MPQGRRILLMVQPTMLQGALARVLSVPGFDEVVQVGSGRDISGHFDVALVSRSLPQGVNADVVITLPDQFGSGGFARVKAAGTGATEVAVRSSGDVVALLDRLVPGPTSRMALLASLTNPPG
jgi:hypothetical protein